MRLGNDATTHTSPCPSRSHSRPERRTPDDRSGRRACAPLTIAQALAGLVEVRQALPLAGKCALDTASYGIFIAM
jgi:hypothetical protein